MDRMHQKKEIEERIAELIAWLEKTEGASDPDSLWLRSMLENEIAKETLQLALLQRQL